MTAGVATLELDAEVNGAIRALLEALVNRPTRHTTEAQRRARHHCEGEE